MAIFFPAFPHDPIETLIFVIQHFLMVIAPLIRVWVGFPQFFRSAHWSFVGVLLLILYHWLVLLPWSMVTGVNVATMMSPPPDLAFLEKWYRVAQCLICIGLQFVMVLLHRILAWFVSLIPRNRTSIPEDAVPITMEQLEEILNRKKKD